MTVKQVVIRTTKVLQDNSSSIFTALGIAGSLATAYLAARASFKASKILQLEEQAVQITNGDSSLVLEREDQIKLVWKLYIPAAASAVASTGFIIAGIRAETRKTAAAYSLLSVSEKAFTEYRDAALKKLGPKKEGELRDSIAQERVIQNPPTILSSPGLVLCQESHTGRYFNSDMETLRRAVNTINAKMLSQDEATLDDLYHLIGLQQTSSSGRVGWTSSKLLDLEFSAVMTEDGRPCMVFTYNYVKPI